MELKEQVCSLELAKRLKELGVKQESIWWWAPKQDGSYGVVCDRDNNGNTGISIFIKRECSAFTVAELGEMLPWMRIEISNGVLPGSLNPPCKMELWDIDDYGEYTHLVYTAEAYTEANARAKMLIYLYEKGLMKGVVR